MLSLCTDVGEEVCGCFKTHLEEGGSVELIIKHTIYIHPYSIHGPNETTKCHVVSYQV